MQSLGWHGNLLWPLGFDGELRMKPRRESNFWTPVQPLSPRHLLCSRWFLDRSLLASSCCLNRDNPAGNKAERSPPGRACGSFSCHPCKNGEGRGMSHLQRQAWAYPSSSFVGCCFLENRWPSESWCLEPGRTQALLPSPSQHGGRDEKWNQTCQGSLLGTNKHISLEIVAVWACSCRAAPVPPLLPCPPRCWCNVGQLRGSRARAAFQGWSTVGGGTSNGNWNANSYSEWRRGPHKSGVTGTQRHHQDAFAQSRDVSYIRENQGTVSAPEINQMHFFLISEAISEIPCLKSNRKQIGDLS